VEKTIVVDPRDFPNIVYLPECARQMDYHLLVSHRLA
jgi:hypothetical protein